MLTASAFGALDGVRVVELGGIGPAPFCTMVLADMGADVVRVLRPGSVDVGLFVRGKRSVELDLKSTDDLSRLLELVERTDVVVEGFRPGVAERLGVGPAIATERNPGLVYARCTGLGQTGPMHQLAGHDINYIALAGVLALIGPSDARPVPPLNLVGDFAGGGLLTAFGIVCALFERHRSGVGQVIDAAMVDGSALLATMFHELVAAGAHDEQRRGSNILDGGAPYYDTYETADGRWFAVGAVEGPFYDELLNRLGLDPASLPDRSERKRWPELRGHLAAAFQQRTFEEWQHLLADGDACATQEVDLGWIALPAGTLAAVNRTYFGYVDDHPVVELCIRWRMTSALDREWADPEGYWIDIEGEPRVEAAIAFGLPTTPGLSDEPNIMSVLLVGTAMAAVNAIPFVCDAPSGHTTPGRLPVFGARHRVVTGDS